MKNILIVITNFRHGGTNKSLQNFLSLQNSNNDYQFDIFAMEHFGPYKEMLPNCIIIPKNKWINSIIGHWKDIKNEEKTLSLILKILFKISILISTDSINFLYKKVVNKLAKNKKYDAVIAYSEGVPTAFVSQLQHENKIAWIHSDYKSYLELNNYPDETKIYETFKSIVCVSEFTKKEFCNSIKIKKNKVYSIHNTINSEQIKRQSLSNIDDKLFIKYEFNLISVGRIDIVKRFDLIPEIVFSLKKRGLNFKWYLIGPSGFGNAQIKFEQNFKKYDIDDYFIWLGEKDNPYPYIAKSDLLVITSKSEACPYVLNEAKILGIPVLATNFGSVTEFIINEENGYVTTVETIVDKIEHIINNKEEYIRIKENISHFVYDNDEILKKIYEIL